MFGYVGLFAGVEREMITHSRRKTGFTLIELLVSVLILGILLNAAVPSYISSVKNSRGASANSNAHMIATAVQAAMVTSGGATYNAAPMNTLGGTVTTDIGGTIPTNPCTSTNTVATSGTATAWTITILSGGTGWKITPNDPSAKCSGIAVYQLGS